MCITLVIHQESLYDARSTKCKKSPYLSRKNWEIPQNKSRYAIWNRYLQNIITHWNYLHDMVHVVLQHVYKSVYFSHNVHFLAGKRNIIILQISFNTSMQRFPNKPIGLLNYLQILHTLSLALDRMRIRLCNIWNANRHLRFHTFTRKKP